jgi:hypothetical protein
MSGAAPHSSGSAALSNVQPNVQYLNKTMLMWLLTTARGDPARAAFIFDLTASEIEGLRRVSAEDIEAFVSKIDVALFTPRPELLELAGLPPALAGVLATVRGTKNGREQRLARTAQV